MAVTLIAKNQTGAALPLTQLPVPNNELPASPASVTLTDFATVNDIQDDVELIAHITDGNVIINDGTTDLTPAQSLSIVQTVAGASPGGVPEDLVITTLSASSFVSASLFYGDGSNLSNLPAGSPVGSNTEVQFNADGAFGADPQFTWTSGSNTLTVTGDISGSGAISGSAFYGDGGSLTNLPSAAISVYSTPGDNRVITSVSSTEVKGEANLAFDGTTLTITGSVSGSGNISGSDFYGGGANLTDLNASNVSAGTLNNARLPTTISVTNVTASTLVSASLFYGDGSNLTNLPAGSPAGSNTQIQYNADSAFGSDAQFTWASGSNTLTVTGDISASVNISGSDFYGGGANLTDLNASNISAGTLDNARLPATISVTNVTASSLVSASLFYGDGSNLTNLPAGSPAGVDTEIQFNDATAFGGDPQFTWNKTSNTLTVTGDISASVNVSGSDFYGGGANLTDLNASNISAGTLNNARLPTTISVTNVSASTLVSASSFYGDASNLTGLPVQNYNNATDNFIITAADSNTVQGEANLTFDGTTLTITGDVSGSGNVSGSAFYGDGANLTALNASNISAGTLANARLPATISVTNVTASALVSASFLYGDGSNLTNLTIPSGTISRIDSTGAETFYLSISGAVAASVAGDYVRVGPGTYVEDSPINIPAGISVIGEAGWQVTEVSSSTGLGDLFVLTAGSLLKDFNIAIPSDTGSYGAKFAGATGTATINFLSFYGGTGLRGSGYGNTGTGKTIGLEVRYSTGDCDAVLEVTDGILAIEGVHIPNSAGSVDAGMRANSPSATRVGDRGRLQGIDINMGATGVEDGIVVGTTSTVVMQGVNLFNIQNTFHLTSNSASLLVTSGLSEPTVNDIKVDAGLTGDNSITRLSAFMAGKFSIPYTWIPSDHAWTFFTAETDTSEASQQLWGARKIIGHPELGSGLSVGEGANYSTNNAVFTTDGTTDAASGAGADGTGFVDVSVAAESQTGSSFSFQGTTAGHSIMWCTKRVDSSNTTLKHWGLEVDQIGAAATGSGNFIIEYQNASSSWTEIGSMAVSSEEQYRYADKVFLRANSKERIYAGISGSASWDPTEINGVTGRWMRARIEASVTTAPTFERFRLMPSHAEINAQGQKFASGLAQWRKTLVSAGNVFGETGGVVSANFPVGSGSAPSSWTHNSPNSLMNQNGDAIYAQFAIPDGICTAFPLTIRVVFSFDPGGTLTSPVIGFVSAIPVQTAFNLVADPAGGLVPVQRTIANTETTTAKAATSVTFNSSLIGTVWPADTFFKGSFGPFPIAGYYSDDVMLIRFELRDDGNPNQDVAIIAMIIEGVQFTEGEAL